MQSLKSKIIALVAQLLEVQRIQDLYHDGQHKYQRECEELRAQLAAAVEWIRANGWHMRSCAQWLKDERGSGMVRDLSVKCTCGLDVALAGKEGEDG